jgi:hypothetical protein
MSVLDELEGLLREATAKPWMVNDWNDVIGSDGNKAGTTWMSDRGDENARLIVAAVNALPALLAVARAAMAFERDPVPDENWKRLWAAVAALRASSPSGGTNDR